MRAVAPALAPGLLELSLRDLIDEYAVALEVAGRSRRTIDWYRAYLEEFAAFAGRGNQTGTLEDLTPAIARRWLLALQSSRPRPLAPNSMAGRVRTLRAFGGWLQRELQLDGQPLAGLPIPKVPDVLVPSLTPPELRALLEGVNSSRDSIWV